MWNASATNIVIKKWNYHKIGTVQVYCPVCYYCMLKDCDFNLH